MGGEETIGTLTDRLLAEIDRPGATHESIAEFYREVDAAQRRSQLSDAVDPTDRPTDALQRAYKSRDFQQVREIQ